VLGIYGSALASDHFSESGSIPNFRSRCRRAAAALGNRYGAWRSMASMISMGSVAALGDCWEMWRRWDSRDSMMMLGSMVAMGNRWGAEVKCFDDFGGGFAFEGGAAVVGGWVILAIVGESMGAMEFDDFVGGSALAGCAAAFGGWVISMGLLAFLMPDIAEH
jgi:hypothetical protein